LDNIKQHSEHLYTCFCFISLLLIAQENDDMITVWLEIFED